MSSAKMEMSIDDPQFAARTRAEDPEALQAVVHTYLGQILRAARSQQRFLSRLLHLGFRHRRASQRGINIQGVGLDPIAGDGQLHLVRKHQGREGGTLRKNSNSIGLIDKEQARTCFKTGYQPVLFHLGSPFPRGETTVSCREVVSRDRTHQFLRNLVWPGIWSGPPTTITTPPQCGL